MAKVWVLDTETKGTGANMVPLERVVKKRQSGGVPEFVFPEPKAPPATQPEPRTPREFRVIDVMTRRVLGDRLDARATVNLLEDVRSVVDVLVYVREPGTEGWRMLTLREARTLWEYRGSAGQDRPHAAGRG